MFILHTRVYSTHTHIHNPLLTLVRTTQNTQVVHTHCNYSCNPIRLYQSLARTMNCISLTVQDGKYLGKRDGLAVSFHNAANQAMKALGYDYEREEWLITISSVVFLCYL